jgi:hypothetical protein
MRRAVSGERRPLTQKIPEMMEQITQIGAKHNVYFAPVDASKPIGERFG